MQPGTIDVRLPQGGISGEGVSYCEPYSAAIGGNDDVISSIGKAQKLARSTSVVIGNVNICAVGIDQMLSVWRPRSSVSDDIP
jgi:hypothetical protein